MYDTKDVFQLTQCRQFIRSCISNPLTKKWTTAQERKQLSDNWEVLEKRLLDVQLKAQISEICESTE